MARPQARPPVPPAVGPIRVPVRDLAPIVNRRRPSGRGGPPPARQAGRADVAERI